ncbi:MAG TPA: hypothetical protein PKE29_16475 [Phycisphaerales bacterium]|nr:hypothetical protein [Phycisphaerales bacterium]
MHRSCLFCVAGLIAAASSSAAIAQQVSYVSGTYTQDFDTLATSGTTNAWTNGTTVGAEGWYSVFGSSSSNTTRDTGTTAATVYRGETGSGTAGALYSFGVAGANALTDRALGALASGSFENTLALVIRNDGSAAFDSFTLTFDGEQWRNGNNLTQQTLVFDYSVLSSAPVLADLEAANITGYTAHSALDFTGPIATATAGALDGNLAANRVAGITSTVSASVPVGSYLVLRWWDNNDPGNDHALALDNIAFSATYVPTPGAPALLGLGGLAALRRRRR